LIIAKNYAMIIQKHRIDWIIKLIANFVIKRPYFWHRHAPIIRRRVKIGFISYKKNNCYLYETDMRLLHNPF